jgi:hypothetical protein
MLSKVTLYQILLTIHLIGVAFGLGGATISDLSFFRALKMGDRITPDTVNWMRSFSLLIWAGIGILFVSGIGLFLLHPALYLSIPGFVAKMIFVAVLIINGLFLNFYTTARLTTFNFSEHYVRRDSAWRARKLSFVFGAISTTTWYSVMFVAMFKTMLTFTLTEYVLLYLLVLAIAITLSLMLENRLSHKKPPMANSLDHLTLDQLSQMDASSVKALINRQTRPEQQDTTHDIKGSSA